MNALVELPKHGIIQNQGRMSVAEVTQHAIAVQEVMKAVMREGEHYGKIPGTDKPTLYKAGAEKLCMTFRIADEYRTEDLSTTDMIRYRVTCIGRHQLTGLELGTGMGEGSTSEEKYRWRKSVCDEEFDATPAAMRRTKYARGKGGSFYTTKQVRTEPSDLANTVLKMACKRAKMAMVLNVTAASDCFSQDLEDLTDELREHLTEDDREAGAELLRAECLAAVSAATSAEQLKAASKECVAKLQKARDTEGYAQLVQAVQAHGKTLAKPEAPADPPPSPPPALDDDFVREMDGAST